MRALLTACASFILSLQMPIALAGSDEASKHPELERLIKVLLAPPKIEVQPGFAARLVVSPGGQFYDTFYIVPRGPDEVWVSDDAGPTGRGQIVAVDRAGNTRVLVPGSTTGAIIGFDVAPPGFGKYGGQIFTVSQGGTESDGMYIDALIERFDPAAGFSGSTFCKLAPLANGARATVPFFGIFGPTGSAFANRYFAVIAGNQTIYEVTPEGTCKPFVTFTDPVRTPRYIVFTPDHQSMLVAAAAGDLFSNRDKVVLRTGSHKGSVGLAGASGMLISVSADGQVAPAPYLEGDYGNPEFAPRGFGEFEGELFFTRSTGRGGFMPPLGRPQLADSSLYRRTRDGRVELVASGFTRSNRLKFIDSETLWIADHNADMVTGRREWPDGFIVEIKLR